MIDRFHRSVPSTRGRIRRALHRMVWGWRGAGHPVPRATLDDEYASGRWDHFASAQEEPRYAALVRLIHAAPGSRRILDVGCGSGELARRICSGDTDYLGIDLSREGLLRAEARALFGARFLHGDFEVWRPSEPWDLIVFNEVIGYARWPARVLTKFAHWLPPGGALLVSYYRAGNHAAIWRQIECRFTVLHAEEVAGVPGAVWDVKKLAPRSPA